MNRVKRFFKSNIFLAIAINLFYFAGCQLIFGIDYEMLDEMIFSELIADNYIHIGNFSNLFLFWFIEQIQKVIYPINAYTIVSLCFALMAMVTVSYIFFRKFSKITAILATVLLNGMIGINHYATISFTRLPALLSAAGLLCIIDTIYRKKWLLGYIWGALLVILGSMYRYKIFLVSALIIVIYLITVTLLDNANKAKISESVKNFLRELLEPKRLICGVLLFAVCFCLSYTSRSLIAKVDGMSYYLEYTSARSAVWDYHIPDYEECKEEYDAIGIDENDIYMLRKHYFDDQGAFPLEKLYQINEIKENYYAKRSIKDVLIKFVKNEMDDVIHLRLKFFLYASVFIVIVIYSYLLKRKYYLLEIVFLGVAFLLYIYLYIDGRVPYRVVYGIWLPISLWLIYAINNERMDAVRKKILLEFDKKRFVALSLIGTFVISGCFLAAADYRNYKDNYQQMRIERAGINEYIKSHPDDRFELCRVANLFEGNIDNETIYIVNNEGKYGNSHIFNGTYYRLPYYNDFNKSVFKTDNLYANLLNDNVYFVDHDNSFTVPMKQYLEKYYADGKSVEYEIINEIDGYQVVAYSISS